MCHVTFNLSRITLLALFAGNGLCAWPGRREGFRDVLLRAVVGVERLEVRDLGVACLDLVVFVSELEAEGKLARKENRKSE